MKPPKPDRIRRRTRETKNRFSRKVLRYRKTRARASRRDTRTICMVRPHVNRSVRAFETAAPSSSSRPPAYGGPRRPYPRPGAHRRATGPGRHWSPDSRGPPIRWSPPGRAPPSRAPAACLCHVLLGTVAAKHVRLLATIDVRADGTPRLGIRIVAEIT